MDASICSFFANLTYSNENLEYINTILVSNSNPKINQYEVISINRGINGFQAIAVGKDVDNDGKFDDVVISYRGSDSALDWGIDDLQIALGLIPSQKAGALNFYNSIINNDLVSSSVQITLTGHSLGGALTQLVAAETGAYAVTFNAPGMAEQVNISTGNIINYVNLNDFIGCYGEHVGEVRYYLPNGMVDSSFVPHSDYLNKDFNKYITLPSNVTWTHKDALALWGYDVNNNHDFQKILTSFNVTRSNLDNAVQIIEEYLGKPGKLDTSFKYQLPNNYCYCIGSTKDDVFTGTNKNDTLWGNGGNDLLTGGKGNDTLDGGEGVDEYVFVTGDGQDIIQEADEELTSVKDILYSVKDGRVNINSHILTGGTYNETTGQYVSNDVGVTYSWSGFNGSDLVISYGTGDSVTVKDFNNGDLGILFDRSKTTDMNLIAAQLKRDKQTQADRYAQDNSYTTKDVALTYVDESGIEHTIIDCEKTSKILNGYGDSIVGATVDSTGTYLVLDTADNKISLKHQPVDYSSLVNEMKGLTNGIEIKREDLAIQGSDIYIPTSSKDGSPTIENIYYQYTTKPSGGGFLAGLFTVVQLAACLATGQWLGAAFVALNSGIAGNKVAKISSIVDFAITAVSLANASINGIGAIFSGKSSTGSIMGGAAGIQTDTKLSNVWMNVDGSAIVDGVYVPVTKRAVNTSDMFSKTLVGYISQDEFLSLPGFNSYGAEYGIFSTFDLIVNKNTNPNNKYSENYSVNTSTGSISGSVNIETSNLLAPDYSTPEDTPKFELSVDRGCPLILDLGDDGVETLDIDETNIYFDTQNTGFATKTGWVSKNEGLLAVDKNNDGKITQQSELFGSETKSGFEDLRLYDSNNDGVINSSDTDYGKLKVWQDLNENGITDSGELKTLGELGINSINLDVVDLNLEQNQNTITGMSSYTTTDGKTHTIYNVNFAFNKIYTQYKGEYELSLDVLDMPWLRGYGQVKDLQLKMSEDTSFKEYVKGLTLIDDAKVLYDKMDEFLAKWVGCEDIPLGTEVNGINSREIAILNKYLNLGIDGEISSDKKVYFDQAYLGLKNKIYANFIAQTEIGDNFEINYDYKTDSMLYNDNTYEKLITNLPDQKNFYASYIIARVLNDAGSLDGNKLAYTITQKGFGASLISYLNSGFQILDSGEIELLDPNMPMYVIGTSGNDTIVGTENADIIYGMDGDDILKGGAGDDYLSGGNGNDVLMGEDGNDTLIGGSGDDELQGGYGNDTYIYEGQGKDTIIDERWVKIARQEWYQSGWWIFKRWKSRWVYQDQIVDAGNDTVIFGDDVKEKDVQISRNGDDLVFRLKGSDDKLTIKNWYLSSERRVENFVFADGFVINYKQIMHSITDKSGTDTVTGTNEDNFIISVSGNDTVNSKKGDDAVLNYEGNTTYIFNKGDGNDVIMDYQGNDKIKLGSGISVNDVTYLRNNKDLIISINNMTDTITVLNWFVSDSNKIESIEYADGTIHTPIDISNTLSSTIATGYDDVIIGNDEDNVLDGLSGNDYLEGRGGNDTLIGGLGKDIMKGGLGNDTYYVDNLGDQIIENESEGTDTINTVISYELPENVENLTLIGTGDINGKGNNLNNIITGNDGNNILDGIGGVNTLKGGKGDDTYLINSATATDTIVENSDEGTDTVVSSISYTLNSANVENLVLTGNEDLNGTGNSLNNYIEGNKGSNILSGGAGNDTLYGGEDGNDTLKGGTGNDTYLIDSNKSTVVENANEGTDTVISSIDYTLTANLENLTLVGNSGIKGTGNSLNNIIIGNNQNNTFTGGKGNDTLKGGVGADTYIFNKGDGQDIIQEDSPNSNAVDRIVFGAGITKNDLVFTRSGYDLIVSIKNTTDKITIKNSNLAFGSRIERFEFSDGTYIDTSSLYTLTATTSKPNLYSDVSYLNINSRASSVDREYYDEGGLKSEIFYGTNAKISSEKFYNESGVLIQEKTYNSSGLLIKEVNYSAANVISTQKQYTYNSSNVITQIQNYEGTTLVSTEKLTYNSSGLLTKNTIYSKGTSTVLNTIKYTYDSSNQLTTETKYVGTNGNITDKISYTYSNGKLSRKHIQVGYNKAVPKTSGMTYTWDLRTDEDIKYTYGSNGKITKEVTNSGYAKSTSKTVGGVKYTYSEWDTRKSKEVTYTYDTKGNITNKTTEVGYDKPNPTISGMQYTWTMRDDETISYTYNSAGKVTKEVVNGAYAKSVSKTVGGVKYTYSEYKMHKVREAGYVHDSLGNITSKTVQVGYNKPNPTSSGMQYTWAYRTQEKVTYSYNSAHQLTNIVTNTGYTEPVTKTVGGVKYTYSEWKTRKSEEIKYTYNADYRLTDEKVYKYHYNSNKVWTSYLAEQKTYQYDSEGRLILVQHFNDSKLVEVYKYEYTLDSDKYLTKQIIYKGVISNNKVSSYTKYQEVTINSYYNKLVGDSLNNTLNGSNQSDNLQGGAGNDILYGNSGNDILNGGAGADLMVGGTGDDIYVVDNSLDFIVEHSNQGNDTVQTTLDNYTLGTNFENLTLLNSGNLTGKGNSYDNIIKGNAGNNTLYGYAGNDTLDGSTGADTMYGGTGDDTYYVDSSSDNVKENANEGTDTVISSISYTLAANVENLYLSSEAGSINGTGNNLDNKIVGNSSDNVIDGKAGKNTLYGGAGDDTYIIGSSNASDVITEYVGEGTDTVKSSVTFSLANIYNVENLTLTGSDNINGIGNELDNIMTGNSGNNIIRGGAGDDTFRGGGGSDYFYGGAGNDIYYIDNEDTIIEEYDNEGNDSVISSVDYTLTANVENLEFTGTGDLNATGNDLKNIIKGTIGNNIFEGGKGNDIIYGYEGSDTYIFNRGDGVDTIYDTGTPDKYIDSLKFGSGITIDDVRFNKSGNDLIVVIAGTGDRVIIKDSNINPDNRIEQFVFQDGTIIDGSKFYELSVDSSHNVANADFSFANTNAVSPYMDRTYYDHGSLSSNFYFDANRNLVEETYYAETGEISSTHVYTYNEDGTLSTMDDGENMHSYTYSSGLRTDTIVSKTDDSYVGKILTYYNSNNLVTKEDTYSEDNKLLYTSSYTYNSDNKLLEMLEKEVLYNSDGTSKLQNNFMKEYTYNNSGKIAYYFEYGWFKKSNGSYMKYTAVQDNYTYNNYGQTESMTHHIGYMNENEEYVKYKDDVTYTYDSLNKLSTRITESGYRVNNVWQMHVSEKVTYEYDEETGLLSKETVDVGYQDNESWTTKTSQVYTYEYNLQGMLTEKIRTDYTLQASGSYSTVVAQKIVNTYDEETGRLVLTNTYEGSNLIESLKYEYVYDDNGNLISQKLYNGSISNNQANSYEFVKEIAMNYNNKLYGDYNNNVLYGGDFDDYLKGEGGSDTLYGGLGNDILDGGANRDVMIGGKGDDTYYVGNATDKIIELENEGTDTIISDISYTIPENVENLTLIGTREDVTVNGTTGNNVIIGSSVGNEILGYGGNDYLYGEGGNDTLYGGDGDDILDGGTGEDFLSGSSGNDIFVFSKGDGIDTVREYAGTDDRIKLGEDIFKENIAIYKDNTDLIIDYGESVGTDRITVLNQCGTDSSKYVERIELNDGSYLTNADINTLIQNMTAYAASNDIQVSSINDIKDNANLMNLVAAAWHS